MKGKPLAPKSIRNTYVVLRKAQADDERLELVSRNRRRVRDSSPSGVEERCTKSAQDSLDPAALDGTPAE